MAMLICQRDEINLTRDLASISYARRRQTRHHPMVGPTFQFSLLPFPLLRLPELPTHSSVTPSTLLRAVRAPQNPCFGHLPLPYYTPLFPPSHISFKQQKISKEIHSFLDKFKIHLTSA